MTAFAARAENEDQEARCLYWVAVGGKVTDVC